MVYLRGGILPLTVFVRNEISKFRGA